MEARDLEDALKEIANLRAWQDAGHVHPLTCRKDSGHGDLLPCLAEENAVILVCLECDFVQTDVPGFAKHGPPNWDPASLFKS